MVTGDVLREVLRYTDRVLALLERDGAALVVNRAEATAIIGAACVALLDALEVDR